MGGSGGGSSYEAQTPAVSSVGVSQGAARDAARAASQYLGDDFMQGLGGGSASGAMSDSYAQVLDDQRRNNNWEKMIAGIGSKNASAPAAAPVAPAGNAGNTQGW